MKKYCRELVLITLLALIFLSQARLESTRIQRINHKYKNSACHTSYEQRVEHPSYFPSYFKVSHRKFNKGQMTAKPLFKRPYTINTNLIIIFGLLATLPMVDAVTESSNISPSFMAASSLLMYTLWSININGDWKDKREELNSLLQEYKPDVILIQDVRLIEDIDMKYHLDDMEDYKIFHNVPTEDEARQDYVQRKSVKIQRKFKGNQIAIDSAIKSIDKKKISRRGGLITAIHKNISGKVISVKKSSDKRKLSITIKLQGTKKTLVIRNIYAPTGN